jgi:hypothetical protein
MCAASLAVPVAASASTTQTPEAISSFTSVPVHGTAANGKAFKGHFDVSRFTTQNGSTYAVGHLTGFVGQRSISRSGVAIPISVNHAAASTAAACPVLNLTLGPLNLNLLGLHVHLNQVVLNITAVSGPGNLLGNLLCDVSNLLNGSSLLPSQVTGLLSLVQQTLSVPTLLSL